MDITGQISNGDSSTLIISINNKLDYNLRNQFRDIYLKSSPTVTNFTVDLMNTDYIDSSGLGMLLILKEHADNLNGKVNLTNASANVKEILELSNFDQIFDVS